MLAHERPVTGQTYLYIWHLHQTDSPQALGTDLKLFALDEHERW